MVEAEADRFLDVFRVAALQAGAVARHLQGRIPRERKSTPSGTPESEALTAVDLAAQDVILHLLHRELRHVAVDAEEDTELVGLFDGADPEAPLVVIDPLDGTLNYARGSADYAVMGALVDRGLYQAALIHYPEWSVTCSARRGAGCFVTHGASRPRRITRFEGLPDLVLVSPGVRAADRQRLSALGARVEVSRCSAVDAAAPVVGRARVAVSEGRADRRRAIGFLITREAGGGIRFGAREWLGEDPEDLPAHPGPTIAAASQGLAERAWRLLRG